MVRISRGTHLVEAQIANDAKPPVAEDAPPKDKHYRKYANGIDRALSLFETALQEWADYISFLNRLLKVRIP